MLASTFAVEVLPNWLVVTASSEEITFKIVISRPPLRALDIWDGADGYLVVLAHPREFGHGMSAYVFRDDQLLHSPEQVASRLGLPDAVAEKFVALWAVHAPADLGMHLRSLA